MEEAVGSFDIIPSLSSVACLRHKKQNCRRRRQQQQHSAAPAAAAAFDVCSRQNNVAASPAAAASFLSQFARQPPPPPPPRPQPASQPASRIALQWAAPTSAAPSLQVQSHSQSKLPTVIHMLLLLCSFSADFTFCFIMQPANQECCGAVPVQCLSSTSRDSLLGLWFVIDER